MPLEPVVVHERGTHSAPVRLGRIESTTMYGQPNVAERLPPESEMDRPDALRAFVAIINTAKPDHPDLGDPWPIDTDDVDYGVTRNYYARCGPRRGINAVVSYKTRMTHINGLSRAAHLALLTHEITHVPVGHGYGESGHPPAFWREMAFHALEVRDAIDEGVLDPVFGEVDADAYLRACANNPKPSTVDRRSLSVSEAEDLMADLLGV